MNDLSPGSFLSHIKAVWGENAYRLIVKVATVMVLVSLATTAMTQTFVFFGGLYLDDLFEKEEKRRDVQYAKQYEEVKQIFEQARQQADRANSMLNDTWVLLRESRQAQDLNDELDFPASERE